MYSMQLKNKLKAGDVCLGAWITISNPIIAEIFANAGYDWVVVDLEHSSISIDQAGNLIRVIDLAGSSPLVRLTANDKDLIKRVMDSGAHGIVVPNVKTPDDAQEAVLATRYQPYGSRGVGLGRAQDYGPGFRRYLDWQKEGPLVIVMIEDKSALNRLGEIFNVHGVDGFLIGPYDLSCSMGIPGDFENPRFLEAIDSIVNAGRKAKCPAGFHLVEPSPTGLKELISEGYQFIAYGVDIRMLDLAARLGIDMSKTVKHV